MNRNEFFLLVYVSPIALHSLYFRHAETAILHLDLEMAVVTNKKSPKIEKKNKVETNITTETVYCYN